MYCKLVCHFADTFDSSPLEKADMPACPSGERSSLPPMPVNCCVSFNVLQSLLVGFRLHVTIF